MKLSDLESAAAKLIAWRDRRAEPRFAVAIPARAVVSHPSDVSSMLCDGIVEAFTPRTASLRLLQPVKKRWLVKLTLTVPGHSRVELRGRIVRRRTKPTEGGMVFVHDIALIEPADGALEAMASGATPMSGVSGGPASPAPTLNLQTPNTIMAAPSTQTVTAPRTASANFLLAVLGGGARIEGRFQVEESIEIQCQVAGELHVGGTVVIGEHGAVSADITTVNAIIRGRYEGNLKASGSVEIASTACVNGSIETNALAVAKGAAFTGSVTQARSAPAPTLTATTRVQPGVVFETDRQIPVARLPLVDVTSARPGRGPTELT